VTVGFVRVHTRGTSEVMSPFAWELDTFYLVFACNDSQFVTLTYSSKCVLGKYKCEAVNLA
jgi:hypothetical protein